MEAPPGLVEAASRLDKHYIPARYPNGFASGYPGKLYTRGEAEGAIADAQEVLRVFSFRRPLLPCPEARGLPGAGRGGAARRPGPRRAFFFSVLLPLCPPPTRFCLFFFAKRGERTPTPGTRPSVVFRAALPPSLPFLLFHHGDSARGRHGRKERFCGGAWNTAAIFSDRAGAAAPRYSSTRRRRRALPITETELRLIAALAIIGLSRMPKNG